jgi:hypothetical protein
MATKRVEVTFDDGSKASADIDIESLKAMVLYEREKVLVGAAQATIQALKALKATAVTVS